MITLFSEFVKEMGLTYTQVNQLIGAGKLPLPDDWTAGGMRGYTPEAHKKALVDFQAWREARDAKKHKGA